MVFFLLIFLRRAREKKERPKGKKEENERKKVTVERENGSMKGRNESSIPGSPATTVSHLHFHSYHRHSFKSARWEKEESAQERKGLV